MASPNRREPGADPAGDAVRTRWWRRRWWRPGAPARQGLFFVLVAVILFGAAWLAQETISFRGRVYEAIARELVDNTTEGRQALVSSVWWAPLPTLLRLPLVLAFPDVPRPLASQAVGALMGAASLVLMLRIFEQWGLGRWSVVLVLALAIHPLFLRAGTDGAVASTVLYFVLLAMHGFIGWADKRSLRYLVYLAFAVAMLTVTSFEMTVWCAVAFLFFLGDLTARRCVRRQREAVFVVTLTPLVYTVLLWILLNWLVMGDGFYLVRSLTRGLRPIGLPAAPPGLPADVLEKASLLHVSEMATMFCAAAALVFVAARRRGGAYLGLCAAAVAPLCWLLHVNGLLWDSLPLLLSLAALFVVMCGYLTRSEGLLPRSWGRPLCAALALGMSVYAIRSEESWIAADRDLQADERMGHEIRQIVEHHALARSEYAKIYACGYSGLLLARASEDAVIVPSLDFNFNETMRDYRGHRLFVLVHRPEGRSGMDSLHWKFPDIYPFGSGATLFERDFGPWRLYEIVQPYSRRGNER